MRCVAKLWWSKFHKFWKLWNCDFLILNFGILSKTWILPWMDLMKIIIRFQKIIYLVLFYNFRENLKIGEILDTKMVFSSISQFFTICEIVKALKNCVVLWLWCMIKKSNCVVLWNCDFSQSQLHNFTILFYNSAGDIHDELPGRK